MSKRDDIEVRAARALRVVQDPEFIAAFSARRDRIVSELEALKFDGTKNTERKAVELVRELQAAVRFKGELVRVVHAGDRSAQRRESAEAAKPDFDPTAVKNPNDKKD